MATQSVRIGWRPYVNVVTQVVNAVDADAQAFITAAGITNLTQQSAINTLVTDLKGYGIWTKMKALYPMVGGSATSHKFNLKDPRDLDVAFRLAFSVTGWTHTSTGAKPNGTTGYADTKLNPSTNLTTNEGSLGFYSRTNNAGAYMCEIGAITTNPLPEVYFQIHVRFDNNYWYCLPNTSGTNVVATTSDSTGFYQGIRLNSTTVRQIKNTTFVDNINSYAAPNSNVLIGSRTQNISSPPYSNRECAFAYIGNSLTTTDATNFYTAVQKFQTTLGRQIGSPIVSDTDAQAFINAAGLTDLGQANAVNTLVTDLKTAGVWTKMKALYPFVGGTATSHKFNLKDPRDLNAAFRLTFNGGWTHTATGALPNGTTGYADTNLVPSSTLTNYSSHLSFYSRTNRGSSRQAASIGSYLSPNEISLRFNFTAAGSLNNSSMSGQYDGNGLDFATYVTSTTNYFLIGNRTANNINKIYENGILKSTNTTTTTKVLPSARVLIGALSDNTNVIWYDNLESTFASIGDGLTDTEATAFYTAVQKYQTSLGRQIGTPVLESGQTAGLLETYSGAAAAYSLRKLRNGYYGNAIRVRRSSDNTEQDIAFNTSGGLDTTSLLAFVGNGNGFVTTWYDQSGNNLNRTQTIAATQPQIILSGTLITTNSKPAMYFNGTNTTFAIQGPKIGETYMGAGYSSTVLDVTKLDSSYSTTEEYPLFGGLGWYDSRFSINNNKWYLINTGTGISSTVNATANQVVSSVVFAFATDRVRINGTEVINGNVGTNGGTDYNHIGQSYLGKRYKGYFQEHIIYASDKTSDLSLMESNINSYYSIY